MKKFNINDYMYIQITEYGWIHLRKTVGDDYIKHCITPYKEEINGEIWYRLQCHSAFDLMPINIMGGILFNTTVMFDNEELKDIL